MRNKKVTTYSKEMNRLDIVLFGATGFTGRVTIPSLAKLTKGNNISWGISGRSASKLKQVLSEASNEVGEDLSSIPIIVADVEDEKSMESMASQAKVVLNMAGPFRFYGEPVVRACLKTRTHQIDISGEPQHMEEIELKYNEEAKKQNVYIISSCGIDSIPADLGAQYLIESVDGTLNSIDGFIHMKSKYPKKGSSFNYATWVAAINGIHKYKELVDIRKALASKQEPMPKAQSKLKTKKVTNNPITGQWAVTFPGADTSVMQRSQRYFYKEHKRKPIQIAMYMSLNSITSVIASFFSYSALGLLSSSKYGRELLLKHPKLFTFGTVSHEHPIKEECESTEYTMYLRGRGWPRKEYNFDTNKVQDVILGKITGIDPAYGGTGIVAVTAAITLLEEINKFPKKGGVYTPAAAFAETSLIARLNSNGLKFEIVCKM